MDPLALSDSSRDTPEAGGANRAPGGPTLWSQQVHGLLLDQASPDTGAADPLSKPLLDHPARIGRTETPRPGAQLEQNASVSIGGADGDHFVFAPGIGAENVTNFNTQQDTIELDHFSNAQTIQELQSLITTDTHGDAVINLGHNDSVTLDGVTTQQLQQGIQAGHVLLH